MVEKWQVDYDVQGTQGLGYGSKTLHCDQSLHKNLYQ